MDELEELVTRLDERVTSLLNRIADVNEKVDQARGRQNAVLIGLMTSILLLVVNILVERL